MFVNMIIYRPGRFGASGCYPVIGRESGCRPRFVTCCSQVFDADGSGLEFVAYDAHEVEIHRDNPFLSRTEMFRVMTRSMDLYRRRHAGRSPHRVMVHKTTEFKRDEVDGCMEAFHLCEDVGWRGIRIDRDPNGGKGRPARFPVPRGTTIGLGPREALLWTHGDVEDVTARSYFQGGRFPGRPQHPTPHSLSWTCRPRHLGRYRSRHTRALQNELE